MNDFIVPDSTHPSMKKLKDRIKKEKPYPSYEQLDKLIALGVDLTMNGKCIFCETPCGNDHCPTKGEK
jgi:hypothetical protein